MLTMRATPKMSEADRKQRVHAAIDQPGDEDLLEHLEMKRARRWAQSRQTALRAHRAGILNGCMPFTLGGQNATFSPSCHCTRDTRGLAHRPDQIVALVPALGRACTHVFHVLDDRDELVGVDAVPACSIAALSIMNGIVGRRIVGWRLLVSAP